MRNEGKCLRTCGELNFSFLADACSCFLSLVTMLLIVMQFLLFYTTASEQLFSYCCFACFGLLCCFIYDGFLFSMYVI